jgi:hypothetical protein
MRLILARSLTLATFAVGGCISQPAADHAGSSSRGTDDGGFGWPIECFDPDTSELDPNCPVAALHEAIAVLQMEEDEKQKNDIDLDGIPNEDDLDVDGDGEPNKYDRDIDDDGLMNGHDPDADADGQIGKDDPDEDGDGLSDRFDLNDDGDGLFDDEDSDDDGNGNMEDDEDDQDEPEAEEPESQPLDDLVERQRNGQLSDDDRAQIAKEITERLDSPRVNDIVLKAIQDLGNRSDDPLRKNDGSANPPQIEAIDAVYSQLGRALRQGRQEAGIKPGDPTTDQAVLKALGEFIPRLQSMDELSKTFQLESIGELSRAVNNLRTGLGSADRVRDFTQALTRSNAANPIGLEEDLELEKLTTGAALLGSTFDTTSGGDLLHAIRMIDGLVDSLDELTDALRDVRDLGRQGSSFDDAVDDVVNALVGDIQP